MTDKQQTFVVIYRSKIFHDDVVAYAGPDLDKAIDAAKCHKGRTLMQTWANSEWVRSVECTYGATLAERFEKS